MNETNIFKHLPLFSFIGVYLISKILFKLSALANKTHQQSLVEIFVQELDQIYYPGYTEELIASEPEKFNWELKEFQGQFSN
jgi:hypothetical protein